MHDDVLDIPSHLRSRIPAPASNGDTRSLEREDERGLPSLVEREYRAFGRPANKPLYSVHFVNPTGEVRSFQYHHLDSDSRYAGATITIRFVGAPSLGLPPIQVTIEGRNLWELYDYVHQHRAPWVMVAPRDFSRDGQTIVTAVTFAAVESPAEER